MVATLQSRKEALEAKIQEKNEELKRLCLQEADLTGVIPPEIPLEPGEPPPQVRRRVGTSFSFPQNLINNIRGAGDETLTALELECKVQTNIAEAALSLANDSSANKSSRRKHRLMYRQSQRRLMELETRLTLLRQGKSQQVKKKPRPNTTAVDLGFMWNNTPDSAGNTISKSTWPRAGCSTDEVDHTHDFPVVAGYHRSLLSSGTSHSSSSPRIDVDCLEESRVANAPFNTPGLPPNALLYMSLSQPNFQDVELNKHGVLASHAPTSVKKSIVRRQWDTQSAGGTLLPNQTYPDHSHQPNLNRTQSLGSMEANTHKSKDSWSVVELSREPKEKEWYETSLDSAPSPPIRTSSRLPPAARMMYHLHEAQGKNKNSHPVLVRTHHNHGSERSMDRDSGCSDQVSADSLVATMQTLYLTQSNSSPRTRSTSMYVEDPTTQHATDPRILSEYNMVAQLMQRDIQETHFYHTESAPSDGSANILQHTPMKQKQYLPLKSGIGYEREVIRMEPIHKRSDSVYINIPEESESLRSVSRWIHEECNPEGEIKGPGSVNTPPYYHGARQTLPEEQQPMQAVELRSQSTQGAQGSPMVHHPPHAITQNEITFDTIVPFESPQNHTVVQAGKWQPYREVTKPFEMSDFYKYSTKFRQRNPTPGSRALTPDNSRSSPNNTQLPHQKGIYQPLKPMTCQPVESRTSIMEAQLDREQLLQVSAPEIV